jgi:DNA-directed RNA polymerase specialized sigma24 family protein
MSAGPGLQRFPSTPAAGIAQRLDKPTPHARARLGSVGERVACRHRRRSNRRMCVIQTILPVSPGAGVHPSSLLCSRVHHLSHRSRSNKEVEFTQPAPNSEAATNVQARNSVPGSGSRRSWQAANLARRKRGRRKAAAMLAMKLSKFVRAEIADLFSTTPGNVYVRLHRFRCGRYGV